MKKGLTLLVFVMDRSGSMASIINDSIGGFNTLIEKQKEDAKLTSTEVRVSLVIFDNHVETIYHYVDINEVKPLTSKTFYAAGMTSLNDAVGMTIVNVGNKLSTLDENERPEKVLVTIMTDGHENTSKEYNAAQVKELVTLQESKYDWTFNFVGANIDSFHEGNSRGFCASNTANYTPSSQGVTAMFMGISDYATTYRGAKSKGIVADLSSFVTNAEKTVKRKF